MFEDRPDDSAAEEGDDGKAEDNSGREIGYFSTVINVS
jgi:hypothetical protein